jgi:O-acetylserine/cysteine efflux transporter
MLPARHLLLALAVIFVWGTNFVVIRVGLAHLPPLLFAALRFSLACLPALFIKRPKVAWKYLAAYGLLIGAGQFGVLFIAMRHDISPGIASLVVQTQVFFTIGLSVWLAKEKVRGMQWLALLLAAAGLAVIGLHSDATTTPLGLGLVLFAGLSWGVGNMVAKASGPVDALAYVVWSSLFAAPALIILSLVFEGLPAMVQGVQRADLATWSAVAWQTVGNTLFGYAVWGWLLARHPASKVAPLALMIPIFGMGASALVLGESLPGWKLGAAALVLGGLALNVFAPKRAVLPAVATARQD